MKFFRLKLWLAKRSKRLDKKFTKEFWDWQHETTNKIIDSIEISTEDIKFVKRR